MKLKICGLTRRRDVEAACDLGATHLGFVIAPDSPRCIDARRAGALAYGLAAQSVLVTRGLDRTEILKSVQQSNITRVQLHGASEGNRFAC